MSAAPRTRARISLIIAAALAATAVLFVLLLHAPFTRRAVLGYVLPRIEREYQLQLTASRLDYNVAAMRVGLADVCLAAPHTPNEPFFTADYVLVDVPWRVVLGDVVFDDISVTNGRVAVRRRADGTSNLPSGSDEPSDEPAPLRVRRLAMSRLAVDLRDEQAVASLWLPALDILLTPGTVGRTLSGPPGHIRLVENGVLRMETQETTISQLTGMASFDGRALHLTDLDIRTDEIAGQLNGSLTLIARDQASDVRIRGTVDSARLARWFVT